MESSAESNRKAQLEHRSFSQPDRTRSVEDAQIDLVAAGSFLFGRATFQPGWRWSKSVKPIVGTESCQVPHLTLHISGRLRVRMDDGTEREFGPGDIGLVPPGHDAWVVGDEPVVAVDICGLETYACGLEKQDKKK